MRNHSGKPDESHVDMLGKEYSLSSLLQLFNFQPLDAALAGTVRILQENFSRLYPSIVGECVDFANSIKGPVSEVGVRFARQCREIAASAGDLSDERLQKRIKDAANYFIGQLNRFDEILEKMPQSHDNRRVELKLRDRLELLSDQLRLKRRDSLKFSQRRISPKTVTLIQGFCPSRQRSLQVSTEEDADGSQVGILQGQREPRAVRRACEMALCQIA